MKIAALHESERAPALKRRKCWSSTTIIRHNLWALQQPASAGHIAMQVNHANQRPWRRSTGREHRGSCFAVLMELSMMPTMTLRRPWCLIPASTISSGNAAAIKKSRPQPPRGGPMKGDNREKVPWEKRGVGLRPSRQEAGERTASCFSLVRKWWLHVLSVRPMGGQTKGQHPAVDDPACRAAHLTSPVLSEAGQNTVCAPLGGSKRSITHAPKEFAVVGCLGCPAHGAPEMDGVRGGAADSHLSSPIRRRPPSHLRHTGVHREANLDRLKCYKIGAGRFNVSIPVGAGDPCASKSPLLVRAVLAIAGEPCAKAEPQSCARGQLSSLARPTT